MLKILTLVTSVSMVLSALTPANAAAPVPYPDGWRSWSHVKSMAITGAEHPLFTAFGGLHHVYVNRVGRSAMERGGTFPDGSVIVFDLLAADEKGGAWTEGPRKFIGVMHKNATRYAATGGWGWEGFEADSHTKRLVTDAGQQCFGCHQPQKSADFVFSHWRR